MSNGEVASVEPPIATLSEVCAKYENAPASTQLDAPAVKLLMTESKSFNTPWTVEEVD